MKVKNCDPKVVKRQIIASVGRGGNVTNELMLWLKEAIENEVWTKDVDYEGRPFESLADWLVHMPPPGCGIPEVADRGTLAITYSQIMQYAEQHNRDDIVEHLKVPKRKAGRPRKEQNGKSRPRGRDFRDGGKNRKATLLTRLMEENPDFYKAYLQGEYRSVRSAAEAAGLVPPGHDPLMRMKAYWRKATKAQRKEFLAWIKTAEAR